VVPGGRVEPDETVAETAVRELAEETGLEVQVVRVLGIREQESWRVPGVRDENHFVHAAPAGPTRDEWIHGGAFHCRWIPLLADSPVFAEHGALLGSIVRKRVVAYVTRGPELLVFEHEGTTQVPAGRVDADESLAAGLAREVEEETGITGVRIVRELAGPDEIARLYDTAGHENHAFHAVTEAETPEAWEHQVTGTGMDSRFTLRCRWVSLDDCPPLWGKPDPLVERLRASITEA
jgi:8-oxo-dGTP pyrophosphatase MutT (NUDIX family)